MYVLLSAMAEERSGTACVAGAHAIAKGDAEIGRCGRRALAWKAIRVRSSSPLRKCGERHGSAEVARLMRTRFDRTAQRKLAEIYTRRSSAIP